jgi:hypothetical protein
VNNPQASSGPWSGVPGLVGYGGRISFVNSVKLVDHNSADMYFYDPTAFDASACESAGHWPQHGGIALCPVMDCKSLATGLALTGIPKRKGLSI